MTVIETSGGKRPPVVLAAATLTTGIAGLLLAFTALMALFLGAEGPGLAGLLGLTGWLLLPAGVLTALSLRQIEAPGQSRVSACWSRLPAWLVIAVAMMLLLALLAELAVWLVEFSGGDKVSLAHYLPILSVLVYALTLTAGYALVAPAGEGGVHRGPVRHSDPVRRDTDRDF